MDELAGTLVHRWYVSLFGLAFFFFAVRHLGWRRTLAYAAVAFAVGALAENGSASVGFPYTRYEFNPALKGDELWIGDVPLFVPLSYTFMGYFAFAAGRLLASGPWRTRAARPWQEFALAWMLAVWALWVVDPMSRLGDEFYLGEVFQYEGPGFWFGLPLGSQLGFALTSLVLLSLLFFLSRTEVDQPVAGLHRHPHFAALVTWHVQVFHIALIGFVVGADAIAGSAFLMWIPAALVTAVHWSNLRAARTAARSRAEDDGETDEPVHEHGRQALGIAGGG